MSLPPSLSLFLFSHSSLVLVCLSSVSLTLLSHSVSVHLSSLSICRDAEAFAMTTVLFMIYHLSFQICTDVPECGFVQQLLFQVLENICCFS